MSVALGGLLAARVRDDPRVARARALREAGVLPFFRASASTCAPLVEIEGRERVMLGSANYLGLADHPAIKEGARRAIDRYGSTVTGSRLLNGTTELHVELEAEIAGWYGKEAALVFTTGYQANVGTISSLIQAGDTVVADSSSHASLIDGCTLAGAKVRAFRHNRIEALERCLDRAGRDGGGVLVVTEGVFSMEGDVAPLDEVARCCEGAGAMLMVDEAHGAGVIGATGTGAAELFGVSPAVDVHMGCLSKAMGATGGYVAGDGDLIEYLRTGARSFLFSTAPVPATLGAALAAIRLRRSSEGAELAERVAQNARYLREGLEALGLQLAPLGGGPGGEPAATPIVPVVLGDDERAIAWWQMLFDRGVFVSVALHPAVPPSGALLRLSVMATHTREQLDRVVDAFGAVLSEEGA